MHGHRIPRPISDRENKQLQRAILATLLHEFPDHLTRNQLAWRGFGFEEMDRAVFVLHSVGLLFRTGDVILPSLPARHFEWLESP
jgi:hypothetical protein